MIQHYSFGLITIDGKTYEHDVEVRWNGKVLDWWRKQSHIIDVDDVKRAAEQKPEMIIIGTGESGIARMTAEAQEFIAKMGIKIVIDATGEAVKTFNLGQAGVSEDQNRMRRAIGLFHLTC